MSKKDEINQEFKAAFQAHDDFAKTVLGGLKSAILYEEVAKGKKDEGLSDAEIENVLAREAKKRDDAIVMYRANGATENAEKEIREKAIIAKFLPAQMSDEELAAKVSEIGASYEQSQRGQLIGAVKKSVGNSADGARVAGAVAEFFAK
jgi:uncharacterized protein YqeY